ncbi:MAG: double-strand break repair protein AddB [Pseudomonadota bacterium]
MLFKPTDKPRVFALPLGRDFAGALAAGLLARAKDQPPDVLARTEIIVNTGRMARAVSRAITEAGPGPLLLPRVRVITDLDTHPALPEPLPPPVPPLRRQLVLAQTVGALLRAKATTAPMAARFDLAASLAALLDEMQGEGVAPARLDVVDVGQHAAYWAQSQAFLRIIGAHWDATPGTDPQDRLRLAADRLVAHWQATPPPGPVIVAGSTGSRGATAGLMAAVARLPQGAVVLPGWDGAQPAAIWDGMAGQSLDHHQSTIRAVCARMGVDPGVLPVWDDGPRTGDRGRLVSLALRPAPFTDQWLTEGPSLADALDKATAGIALQEADTDREEAVAIAFALREAAQMGQTAVLITPDRTLARRVTAALSRWGITPDDSAGRPLAQAPPGVFLRLVAATLGRPLTPLRLVELLKHPLAASGLESGDARLALRRYEASVLRGGAPTVDLDALCAWAKARDLGAWATWLHGALLPVIAANRGTAADFLAAHRRAAEALARGPNPADPERAGGLWDQQAGRAARVVLDDLTAEAAHADVTNPADYRALFDTVIGARNLPQTTASHPGIAIWGTLEARMAQADLVVLGALTDSVWPGAEPPDPWLNRAMRATLGLPPPERVTGLSAHDFAQAVSAPRVILSRPLRSGDAPTVASRWTQRLTNLLAGLGPQGVAALDAMRRRGADRVAQARAWDRRAIYATPAPRPAPAPPVAARFNTISVTQVERLIRDPYAIYARKTLKLKPLDPFGREPDPMSRGNLLHKVMERFVDAYPSEVPPDARAHLIAIAEAELAGLPWAAAARLWRARLLRIADWLVDRERSARADALPLVQEKKGSRVVGDTGVTLVGTADRIDLTPDGGLVVLDYKSGTLPTKRQVEHFTKQLPLEAAIAVAGGFEGVEGTPTRLEYVGLSGPGMSLEGRYLGFDTDQAETAETWARFCALIAQYRRAESGFLSRRAVEDMGWGGDYDHLARFGEWAQSDPAPAQPVGQHTP